jgi:hypothetical protein
MSNWLKRLFGGGSESSTSEAPEPATAPEPPSMPAEPAAEPETSGEGLPDAGDEPA